MTIPARITYNAETVFGVQCAEMASHFILARQLLDRIVEAALSATNNGADTSTLETGNASPNAASFGVYAGQGHDWLTALQTLQTVLAADDVSDQFGALVASLDNGS